MKITITAQNVTIVTKKIKKSKEEANTPENERFKRIASDEKVGGANGLKT